MDVSTSGGSGSTPLRMHKKETREMQADAKETRKSFIMSVQTNRDKLQRMDEVTTDRPSSQSWQASFASFSSFLL